MESKIICHIGCGLRLWKKVDTDYLVFWEDEKLTCTFVHLAKYENHWITEAFLKFWREEKTECHYISLMSQKCFLLFEGVIFLRQVMDNVAASLRMSVCALQKVGSL